VVRQIGGSPCCREVHRKELVTLTHLYIAWHAGGSPPPSNRRGREVTFG
jgi:hypothetical protein